MQVDVNKEYSFNDDQFLYKYIDLHRLIYFLTTGKLFFSPLIYFEDPLEGISKHTLEDNQVLLGGATESQQKQDAMRHLHKVQQNLFASCWFLGSRESQAMWQTYSNSDSVAIRFNPQHLCDTMVNIFSTMNNPGIESMIHGKVEYFKLSPLDDDEALKNCGHRYCGFIKDSSYRHEEEFRFLLIRYENYPAGVNEFFEFSPGPLQQLEFSIISHPAMEQWKYNNIKSILKYTGLEKRLLKSEVPVRRQVLNREL